YVLADHSPRSRVGAVADPDGSHEHGVTASARVVTDYRAVLVHPVVVDEHRRGTDVDAFADVGVAHVGQVRHLGALTHRRVLHFDEGADLVPAVQARPGTQVGVGADGGLRADHGFPGDRVRDDSVLP